MAEIKKRIRKLSRLAGSKTQARRIAEEWYIRSVKSLNERSVIKTIRRMQPGKIYVFRYENPKYKDELEWWDLNPVVLALDPVDGNDLGINLNLLPIGVKEDLLDFIYDRLQNEISNKSIGFRNGDADRQGSLSMTYQGAKTFLSQYGFDFAIRQYIPSRKTQQAVIAYENWADIALCDFIELNGSSVGKIRYQFRQHLNR